MNSARLAKTARFIVRQTPFRRDRQPIRRMHSITIPVVKSGISAQTGASHFLLSIGRNGLTAADVVSPSVHGINSATSFTTACAGRPSTHRPLSKNYWYGPTGWFTIAKRASLSQMQALTLQSAMHSDSNQSRRRGAKTGAGRRMDSLVGFLERFCENKCKFDPDLSRRSEILFFFCVLDVIRSYTDVAYC